MFAPLTPYRTGPDAGRARRGGIVGCRSPSCVCRAPFWATFLLASGFELFRTSYSVIGSMGLRSMHFLSVCRHTTPRFADQVPRPGDGVYIRRR
jgi:hypothetical protein